MSLKLNPQSKSYFRLKSETLVRAQQLYSFGKAFLALSFLNDLVVFGALVLATPVLVLGSRPVHKPQEL